MITYLLEGHTGGESTAVQALNTGITASTKGWMTSYSSLLPSCSVRTVRKLDSYWQGGVRNRCLLVTRPSWRLSGAQIPLDWLNYSCDQDQRKSQQWLLHFTFQVKFRQPSVRYQTRSGTSCELAHFPQPVPFRLLPEGAAFSLSCYSKVPVRKMVMGVCRLIML